MFHLIEIIWWLSLLLLTGYHLLIFRYRMNKMATYLRAELPGVSVVIAVKNGSDLLIKNLDAFLSQNYPFFEVVIVDDHSTATEKLKLEQRLNGLPNVKLYHSYGSPGKKSALKVGIEKAKHEVILCTDADCRPAGPEWIKTMVTHSSGEDIVLGYSPYFASAGLLNIFIRFETVMTGIQYLSWAMSGRAYMGVGRNMMYSRTLFQTIDPYRGHQDIPYGDDDLLVQKATPSTDIHVSLEKASHVYSVPAATWTQWFRQKHRHLSAAHHYDKGAWWQPGLYGLALITHWLLLCFLISGHTDTLMIIFFLAGLSIRWFNYSSWTQKLGDSDTSFWYPLFEVIYALYLAGMGILAMVAKKKTWN